MSDENVSNEDLFTIIKHGHLWQDKKIKEEIEKIMGDDYFFKCTVEAS